MRPIAHLYICTYVDLMLQTNLLLQTRSLQPPVMSPTPLFTLTTTDCEWLTVTYKNANWRQWKVVETRAHFCFHIACSGSTATQTIWVWAFSTLLCWVKCELYVHVCVCVFVSVNVSMSATVLCPWESLRVYLFLLRKSYEI